MANLLTLVDFAKRLDPDGATADIVEILSQVNPILEDMPFVESNLPTGHRTTVRADIPTPTWRMLNYGVQNTKSRTVQVDETIGMLEAYSEIDAKLAELNGNTAEFRLSEDTAHLEGISIELARTVFYGDTEENPEMFLGLTPRYNTLSLNDKLTAQTNSDYLKNIVSMGGTGSALTSMWLVVWSEQTVHGIFTKGSKAGINVEDLGKQTLFDANQGKFEGYRTHYKVEQGLCVRDWRYIVRICNIDLNQMDDGTAQSNLYKAMIKALNTVPMLKGKPAFYCSPAVSTMLDIAAVEKGNAALGFSEVFGKVTNTFRNVPIRKCHAILENEVEVA